MITWIINIGSEKSLLHVDTERTRTESGHGKSNPSLAYPVQNNDLESVFPVG
jgi:hypothetical protein